MLLGAYRIVDIVYFNHAVMSVCTKKLDQRSNVRPDI